MPAAFVSPIIIERGYTWEVNFDIKLSNGSARDISGWTGYLTASGMLLSATVSGSIGRLSFGRSTAQTSALNFDRINYETYMISGVTAERVTLGELVLSTGMR